MKVTITKITTTDKKKDGSELKDKWDKPQVRVAIQTTTHANRWISGFFRPGQITWKEGDEVEIDIKESDKKDANGLPWLNFYLPRPEYATMQDFVALAARVTKLEGPVVAPETDTADEVNIDEIPF